MIARAHLIQLLYRIYLKYMYMHTAKNLLIIPLQLAYNLSKIFKKKYKINKNGVNDVKMNVIYNINLPLLETKNYKKNLTCVTCY